MNKTAWYSRRWVIVAIHVLAWIIWFSLPYLTQPQRGEPRGGMNPELEQLLKDHGFEGFHPHSPERDGLMFRISVLQNIFLMGIFYLNAYLLIPRFLYKRKLWNYAGVLILLLLVGSYYVYLLHYLTLNDDKAFFGGPKIFFVFFFFFMIAISTVYRVAMDQLKKERLRSQIKAEHLQTELSFLRSQISPHFMFNVLNNMVSLARKGSPMLEPSLIKLSGLMRYMLYETDLGKVSLEKELEYLQSYVELQEQRFAGTVHVNCQIEYDKQGYLIEPMLLIPFVENAFKHGIISPGDSQINISIRVDGGKLLLEIRNRFNNNSSEIKDKTSGIGLTNVKRRLDLLYGAAHHLIIRNEAGWFSVLLQLKLT